MWVRSVESQKSDAMRPRSRISTVEHEGTSTTSRRSPTSRVKAPSHDQGPLPGGRSTCGALGSWLATTPPCWLVAPPPYSCWFTSSSFSSSSSTGIDAARRAPARRRRRRRPRRCLPSGARWRGMAPPTGRGAAQRAVRRDGRLHAGVGQVGGAACFSRDRVRPVRSESTHRDHHRLVAKDPRVALVGRGKGDTHVSVSTARGPVFARCPPQGIVRKGSRLDLVPSLDHAAATLHARRPRGRANM